MSRRINTNNPLKPGQRLHTWPCNPFYSGLTMQEVEDIEFLATFKGKVGCKDIFRATHEWLVEREDTLPDLEQRVEGLVKIAKWINKTNFGLIDQFEIRNKRL